MYLEQLLQEEISSVGNEHNGLEIQNHNAGDLLHIFSHKHGNTWSMAFSIHWTNQQHISRLIDLYQSSQTKPATNLDGSLARQMFQHLPPFQSCNLPSLCAGMLTCRQRHVERRRIHSARCLQTGTCLTLSTNRWQHLRLRNRKKRICRWRRPDSW